MKPSERIKKIISTELENEKVNVKDFTKAIFNESSATDEAYALVFKAILEYLDEQYEADHKNDNL